MTSHKRHFFEARLLWVLATLALALIVILAQPVASLAWLGGAHATFEQAALHEEAVEHEHYHHHRAPQHHGHRPSDGPGKTDIQFSRTVPGPVFAFAATYVGPFQDLLQASLTLPPAAPSPENSPRCALIAEALRCQHSPPVPQMPPILFS